MSKYIDPALERRKYKRLDTHLTVDFSVVRIKGDIIGVDEWIRGTSRDVSIGGLCLKAPQLTKPILNYMIREQVPLELKIHASYLRKPIRAVGEIKWYHQEEDVNEDLTIGLSFTSMREEDRHELVGYAKLFKITSKIAVGISVLLFFGLVFLAVMAL
ncbi:MAG: PilZ domain-containing protein [Candidatus Omnitrophica bacterium]|nr:PilZ domain-containing protein [Candidatus Omnitrophota bacterium]